MFITRKSHIRNMASRILRNINLIFNSERFYSRIKKCSIVVFDQDGEEDLEQSLGFENYVVLCVRGEVVYLNVKTVAFTIFYLFKTRKLALAYVLALLWQTSPVVAVTMIDNGLIFHEASNHLLRTRFIAVQNGNRFPGTPTHRLPLRRVFQSELLCIGQNDVDGYENDEVTFRKIIPVGSLRNSNYMSNVELQLDRPIQKQFDICVISMFDVSTPVTPRAESYLRLIEYVAQYLLEHPDLRLVIAARHPLENYSEEYLAEMQYYKSAFSGVDYLVSHGTDHYSTYRLVDASEVNISFGSTSSIEAINRGRRTLVCQPLVIEDLQLNRPRDWYLSGASYIDFSERLDQYLAISDGEFSELYKSDIEYFSGPKDSQHANKYLRSIIENETRK